MNLSLSEVLQVPDAGIVAVVGAGGKTALILALSQEAQCRGCSCLITTTTKMSRDQISPLKVLLEVPMLVDKSVDNSVENWDGKSICVWASACEIGKLRGILPTEIDALYQTYPQLLMFVESDGARGCWVKAPADWEPVVPVTSYITLGVLNVKALGYRLDSAIVHRAEQVTKLLNKAPDERLEMPDLLDLATHAEGIFRQTYGRRILVFTGGETLTGMQQELLVHYFRHSVCQSAYAIERFVILGRKEASFTVLAVETNKLSPCG
ncbi:putative selenium-dependent hydroxylase accessory protein YqeC [Sporomusaceae bacterium BoRhaA]|uniref:selenium cofactor biosynthesis protein YqeC n=1 Tax=Pelorhabdus rhamnosifermentans TaxID=2772457 RepID=UPI001C06085B|nr:selenium cofactor biosynthesis protein YqeC [Pelorhabdus rhamnosifermentans]MBU2703172.1 putative selenium-dependent hydroxylase accessory protein YqeC [Pelorhabdus rhamnosifermentans]